LKKIDPILSQNDDFLIAYKRAGLLSQQSDAGETSLEAELKSKKHPKLHLQSRLDRPVSGLVLFSKSTDFNKHYTRIQANGRVEKEYLAIVEGKLSKNTSEYTVLDHFHVHDKKHLKARISEEQTANFKPITLKYKVLITLDNYTVLSVILNTGRFHQIRAQLAHIGYPVKGDVKYGARRGNKDRSIHLHSHKLRFKNLEGNKREYVAPIPLADTLWELVNTSLNKET